MQWLIAPGITLFLILAYTLIKRYSAKRLRSYLDSLWGNERALRHADDEQIDDIAQFDMALRSHAPPLRETDSTTWNDLDMDLVFRSIDCSRSIVGSEVLYAMLHEQGRNQEELDRIDQLSDALLSQPGLRSDVQVHLSAIGYQAFHGASRFLFEAGYQYPRGRWLYYLSGALPSLLILAGFFYSPLFLIAILMFFINIIIYSVTKSQWEKELIAIRHIGTVLRCAKKLSALKWSDPLPPEINEMKELSGQLRAIRFWLPLFGMERMNNLDFITDYLKIAFMLDMVSLCGIIKVLNSHEEEVRRLYTLIGRIDACLSVAQLKIREKEWAKPLFHEKMQMEAQSLRHPLLKSAMPNDCLWKSNMLISGANASGKSTFIKAAAINMILSQSLGICFARSLSMKRGTVMSSMAIRDSVTAGESYFITEIKSLRRIIEAGRHGDMVWAFIDEILRGTNTVERIAASASVLSAISDWGMLCMVATHDIELTEILRDSYDNAHFTETVDERGVHFDYLIRQGPATSRNAIRLLDRMGFERTIVERAFRLSEQYEQSGVWSFS